VTNQNYATSGKTDWILAGGATESSFQARLRWNGPSERFVVSKFPFQRKYTENSVSDLILDQILEKGSALTVSVDVEGLEPFTWYHYARVSSNLDYIQQGRIRTSPLPGIRTNFSFAVSACTMTGSRDNPVLAELDDVQFLVHLGDLHYADLDTTVLEERFTKGIDIALAAHQYPALVYMWDDHDFLGNNRLGIDSTTGLVPESTTVAVESFRQAIPLLPASPSKLYHAFTVGTVRFVVSDLRSEASFDQMYSREQKDWFFGEIEKADEYDFLVWVTPSPWIGEAEQGSDKWWGRPDERREVSEWISTRVTKRNLLAISADAHMVAMDDGSNTYYGKASEVWSFPILQSGPMDRIGGEKGGPFSEGCFANKLQRNHQYSVVEVEGNESAACLKITSYRFASGGSREVIFQHHMCGEIFALSNTEDKGSCSLTLFDKRNSVLVVSALLVWIAATIGSMVTITNWRRRAVATVIVFIGILFPILIGVAIPFGRGLGQYDTGMLALLALVQEFAVVILLVIVYKSHNQPMVDPGTAS